MSGSGYSGTPLAKKLTLKDGFRCRFVNMPVSVRTEVESYGLALEEPDVPPWNAVHLFETKRKEFEARLKAARNDIEQDGQIWVSWPKKASKVDTDITEDVIRDVCLPMGLVDIKVCAVDAIWSGLKLVIRKELRTTT